MIFDKFKNNKKRFKKVKNLIKITSYGQKLIKKHMI